MHVATDSGSNASLQEPHLQDDECPPQVRPDSRVTSRPKAPLAPGFQIQPMGGVAHGNRHNGLSKEPFETIKDEAGLWSVSIPLAVPGMHACWLAVGRVCLDALGPGRG